MLLEELFNQPLLELRYEDIPKTEYGYWIDAEGKFISVKHVQHAEVARQFLSDKHSKQSLESDHYVYNTVFSYGWIRVIFVPNVSNYFVTDLTKDASKRAKQTLNYLMKMFKDQIEDVYIGILEHSEDRETYKQFSEPNAVGKALLFINQQIQGG